MLISTLLWSVVFELEWVDRFYWSLTSRLLRKYWFVCVYSDAQRMITVSNAVTFRSISSSFRWNAYSFAFLALYGNQVIVQQRQQLIHWLSAYYIMLRYQRMPRCSSLTASVMIADRSASAFARVIWRSGGISDVTRSNISRHAILADPFPADYRMASSPSPHPYRVAKIVLTSICRNLCLCYCTSNVLTCTSIAHKPTQVFEFHKSGASWTPYANTKFVVLIWKKPSLDSSDHF